MGYGDGRTRTLLAVLAGARTIQDVADVTGAAKSTAYQHLRLLRRDGFVAWEEHRQGTIHALVEAHQPRGAG